MPIDPSSLGNYFTGAWSGLGSSALLWGGRFFVAMLLLGFLMFFYLAIQFKYKIVLRKIEGNTISKAKWERARLIKDKGIPKWKLLMSRKKIKPVDFSYIYPKNKVYLLQTGLDTFVPMKEETELLMDDDGTITQAKKIKPLDEDLTFWYQLQQQQIAKDYLPDDAGKKQLLITFGMILIVVIFAGFVLWLAFVRTDALIQSIDKLGSSNTNWLQNVAQGVAPN